MKRHDCWLSVAIPASTVSDVPHLREKTMKIGLIGRAAAIYRIDEIIVFPDLPAIKQRRETNLISTVLSYMETPQYLRKRLFKIKPELRYVGVLPPLRTPNHPLANRTKYLAVGEYREGVILSSGESGSLVDIGVERPILIPNAELPSNTRITVKIAKLGRKPRAVLANPSDIKAYWGYKVTVSDVPFGQLTRSRSFDLTVATSRYGTPLKEVAHELAKRWRDSRNVLVAFGAPTQGLNDIIKRENLELTEVTDFTVNTIPNQGSETVRTEEALYVSLAILSFITEK
ncbi:MAG: RNA-binding protein [Candidatus Bathyarchaeota archaeon]|nr:MAG: RNA-binding protein [Candidatus Bathyarchaeota archaeon]